MSVLCPAARNGTPEPRCLTLPAYAGSLPTMALSDREIAILDFERSWWTEPGPKEAFIRDRLDLSPARYYELLTTLISSSDAVSYDPLLVRRLRRSRVQRRRARLEGRSATEPRGR